MKAFFKQYYWLGFILVVIAMLYAYVSVLFEPKHIALDIIYGVFFAMLIYGVYHAFKLEKDKIKNISFFKIEHLFLIIGVLIAYSLVHFLEISVVLASSIVGLAGHFLIRKYEVAIYCGSFAGMVSVAIFGFLEVAVLAMVCAFIYALISPLFSGYGGKLGTIAFISSLIVHSLFFDEFLEVQTDFHLGLLLVTTVIGVMSTFYIQHKFNMSSVFSSAATSLIFTLLVVYILPQYEPYAVVFFSASFIGMSSKDKLPNIIFVIISGLILGIIYFIFTELFNGLGGKLGLMAFISVIIVSGISKFYKINLNNKKNHFQ